MVEILKKVVANIPEIHEKVVAMAEVPKKVVALPEISILRKVVALAEIL